jgi:hypothetical protein
MSYSDIQASSKNTTESSNRHNIGSMPLSRDVFLGNSDKLIPNTSEPQSLEAAESIQIHS